MRVAACTELENLKIMGDQLLADGERIAELEAELGKLRDVCGMALQSLRRIGVNWPHLNDKRTIDALAAALDKSR